VMDMKRGSRAGLGLVTAAALLATLAGVAGVSGASTPKLAGQTWLLRKLGPLNRQHAGITARFTASGKVSGFSGCNSYSGSYTTSGNTISVSKKLAVTQKACSALRMAQERAYLAALTAARTYSISGTTLALKGRFGHTLATFGVQSQSLAGTRWTVVSYNNGKQAVVSVTTGTKLTAVFDDKGHVEGLAGCNTYSGPVKATPPKVSIGPLASTRKSCSTPEGVMQQESAYLAALESAATYSIQGSTLEFRTAGDVIAVTLTRAG
jgi:heat shock protein HslJ